MIDRLDRLPEPWRTAAYGLLLAYIIGGGLAPLIVLWRHR